MKRTLIISIIMFLSFQKITAQEYKSMTLTKKELISAGGINIYFKNFDFETDIKIISYVASAYIIAGDISIKVTGTTKFTKDVIHLIEKVKRNERIIFEDIKVRLDDGTTRKLKSIVVKIR